MRRLTSTLAGVVVLAGLATYIVFVDSERPIGDEAVKERVFASVTPDDIEEIEIALASADKTTVRRVDGKWQLTSPVETAADEGELSSIASSLATLDVQSEVEAAAADLTRYGLEPARVEVAFRTKGQTAQRRVLFGDTAPAGGELYARLADSKRVFLVSSFLDSTFRKDTFALRDKTILPFDRNTADSLELTRGTTVMRFAKQGDNWSIVSPFAGRADYGTVEGAIERLSSARMQGIVEPAATELGKYGLDRPSHTMTVGIGSARATLQLGGTENALLFAKDANRPMVFSLAPTLRDDVFKDIGEYRRKDLFDSRSFTTTRAELRRGSNTIVVEKSKDKDGKDVWKNGAGATMDQATVDDVLTRLSGIRAESFAASRSAALSSPTLTAIITFDGKTETVSFARSGNEVVAARPDEQGSAVVNAATFDETMKAVDGLK